VGFYQPPIAKALPPTWEYAVYAGRELVFVPDADPDSDSDPEDDRDWIHTVRDEGWFGHRRFAEWIVTFLEAPIIVDIGANEGYSALVFASSIVKNRGSVSQVAAEDVAGHILRINLNIARRDDPVEQRYFRFLYARQDNFINSHDLGAFISTIEEEHFTTASDPDSRFESSTSVLSRASSSVSPPIIASVRTRPHIFIDIMHIDGQVDYFIAKAYLEIWLPLLKPTGIILIHGVLMNDPETAGGSLFHEISSTDYPFKGFFANSFGLGIATKNDELFNAIKDEFPYFLEGSLTYPDIFPIKCAVSFLGTSDESDTDYDPFSLVRLNYTVVQLYQLNGQATTMQIGGLASSSLLKLRKTLIESYGKLYPSQTEADLTIWVQSVERSIISSMEEMFSISGVMHLAIIAAPRLTFSHVLSDLLRSSTTENVYAKENVAARPH
jgi:hypothetical protein